MATVENEWFVWLNVIGIVVGVAGLMFGIPLFF